MKKGIQCNETERYPKDKWNEITFEFACELDGIPETYTLKLGSRDPITGEILDDPALFAAYHRFRNNQVKQNQIEAGITLPTKGLEERRELKNKLAEEYEQKHGCPPEEDELQKMVDHYWPMPDILHFDQSFNEEEQNWEYNLDCADPDAEAAFPGSESDDAAALHEIYGKLSERHQAVYRRQKEVVDAGAEQPQWQELGRKYKVSHTQIKRDRENNVRIIKKYSETTYRFSYDQRKEKK